jgi:hypothetical protein
LKIGQSPHKNKPDQENQEALKQAIDGALGCVYFGWLLWLFGYLEKQSIVRKSVYFK